MSGLHFDADIDEKKLTKKVNQIYSELHNLALRAANSGSILDNSFKKAGQSADDFQKKTINAGNAMASIGAIVSMSLIANFAKEIANVRGEWQKYEAVLTNTLGSNQDAKDSLDMIAKYGAKTNFQVNELTDSFVKLASQGFKPTRDEMASLGDLAASKAKGFGQLTEAIIDAETFEFERLKEFGIRASKNGDQITLTFKGVKTTIDASAESVRNYILSLGELDGVKGSTDAISKTIVGLASNFEDAVNQMMNSMGKDKEGLIAGSIQAATDLVNNYEKVIDVIKILVATYGTYKAASIALAVVETYRSEMMVTQTVQGMYQAVKVTQQLTFAQWASAKAQGALNSVTLANPYVAAATAIAGLITWMVLFSDTADEAADAQEKVNDLVNAEKAKVETLITIIKSETSANADRAKALKELNDILPDSVGLIDAQTLSTKKGKEAIDDYIKAVRQKAEIENLTNQLNKNLSEQDRISGGGFTMWDAFKTNSKTTSMGDMAGRQAEAMFNLKEQENQIKKNIELVVAGGKAEDGAAKNTKTVNQQILDTKKDLIEAEKKLKELRSETSTATPEEIKKQSDLVERLKDQKEILTGIKVSEKKNVDALKVAQEELEKAVKSGNKAAIEASAQKVTALEIEAKKIKELTELELQRAWRAQFDNQAMTPVQSKGVTPITQIGSLKSVQGILYEVTAVDKTGPVWTKVKAQYADLKKFEKTQNEKGAKDQETLDKENFEKKKQFQEDLLNYSRQLTGELIDQLGLTQEQSKEMQGFADIVFNLASGNYLGAAFSVASSFMSAIFSGSKKEDPTTKALENVNALLEKQSAILSNLAGSNYFELAQKQFDDYGKAIDLNVERLRKFHIANSEGFSPQNPTWTADQFIDSFTNGNILPGTEDLELIQSIIEMQKQRSELLQETFRTALGFDSSDVSDSIFSGIDEGLKLGENSLGGFAQSFGDLMKKALMQSVTDAMNLDITNTFLPEYQKAISDALLTPEERENLENIYANVVRKAETDSANIQSIIGQYTTNASSALTGISAQMTEETGSLVAGQFMAMRVDIKSLQETGMSMLELMDLSLSVLNQIAKNTQPIYRLEAIENGIKEMNINLKNLG